MERMTGKTVLITGAALGQGRAHAIRFAEEGADVIAVDACADQPHVAYGGATESDLEQTVKSVEALDRRCIATKVDVRDFAVLDAAVQDGVDRLGGLDAVVANAGIGASPYRVEDIPEDVWSDMLDVNLSGVWRTCKASIRHLRARGSGSIVLTSSAGGLKALPNLGHYVTAKHGVVGLMRTLAVELAPERIRVNSLHPTQVDTDMIMNNAMYRLFSPGKEDPGREDMAVVSQTMNALPVPWVDPVDVANAALWLASDEARYVTGVALPIDAGMLVK